MIFFVTSVNVGQSSEKTIKHATPDEVRAILEIALNAYKAHVRLSPSAIKKSKPHKRALRNIALPKGKGAKAEKRLIIQKGGAAPFIPILLSSVLPYVLSKIL